MNFTDKKHPRTLQEAFGPYTSHHIVGGIPKSSRATRWAYFTLLVAVLSFAVLMAGCAKKPGQPQAEQGIAGTAPDEHGVVCYSFTHRYDALACVKVR